MHRKCSNTRFPPRFTRFSQTVANTLDDEERRFKDTLERQVFRYKIILSCSFQYVVSDPRAGGGAG